MIWRGLDGPITRVLLVRSGCLCGRGRTLTSRPIPHEGDETADHGIFGLDKPDEAELEPGIVLVDRSENDTRKVRLRLTFRCKCDTGTSGDKGEDGLLAGRMCLIAGAVAKEGGVELALRVRVLPTLHQNDLRSEGCPVQRALVCEAVRLRQHCDQPLAKQRQRSHTRPMGWATEEDDIDTPFIKGCRQLTPVALKYGEGEFGMGGAPRL